MRGSTRITTEFDLDSALAQVDVSVGVLGIDGLFTLLVVDRLDDGLGVEVALFALRFFSMSVRGCTRITTGEHR